MSYILFACFLSIFSILLLDLHLQYFLLVFQRCLEEFYQYQIIYYFYHSFFLHYYHSDFGYYFHLYSLDCFLLVFRHHFHCYFHHYFHHLFQYSIPDEGPDFTLFEKFSLSAVKGVVSSIS